MESPECLVKAGWVVAHVAQVFACPRCGSSLRTSQHASAGDPVVSRTLLPVAGAGTLASPV